MTLTWTGARTLSQIRVNGVTVWNTAGKISGTTLNITDVIIPASTTYNLDRVRFSGNISSGTPITLLCTMTDASNSSVCTVLPAQGSTCTTTGGSLTITSIGKTADPKFYKTVVATYNTSTGKVTAYTATN